MADYSKKKSNTLTADLKKILANLLRPEEPPQINVNLDHQQIADSVSKSLEKVIENNLKNTNSKLYNNSAPTEEAFDSTKSLERLAESMIVQRGNNQSNFDSIGDVKLVKKDEAEVKNTIDLLKDLDD